MKTETIIGLQDKALRRRLTHGLRPDCPAELVHCRYTPKEGVVLHMHFSVEVAVLLEGSIDRIFGNTTIRCRPGDVWFCGMWEPHGYRVVKEPCRAVAFLATPQMLYGMHFPEAPRFNAYAPFLAPPGQRPKITDNNRADILAIAQRAMHMPHDDTPYYRLWCRLYLLELLALLCEGWEVPSVPGAISGRDDLVISKALQQIFSVKQYIKEADVAAMCGINRTTFSRLFKRWMGVTFVDFALRYRLSLVAELLKTSDSPMKSLAVEHGFVDASHLCKSFMKYYGCSPSEYRAANRAD